MSKKNIAIFTIVLALLIDQISKIYVKTHFYLGEEVTVFSDWFIIHFTENDGMAWGAKLSDFIPFLSERSGKLVLTIFRLTAVIFIIYWLRNSIKRKVHNAVIIAISLIFTGAIGNILDSLFYGAIFDESNPYTKNIAELFSDKPYGELFYGKVVDMLYFPIYKGESFTFFNAIFNGADSFITIGVILLFLFNKQAFPKEEEKA